VKKAGGHAGRGSLRKVCVEARPFTGFGRANPARRFYNPADP
jgi:hypothetical protein